MIEKNIKVQESTDNILNKLIDNISKVESVEAIGISGAEFVIPEPGQGDIDIFIYCKALPEMKLRTKVMEENVELFQEIQMDCFSGGHWGNGDFASINGVETWLMYFTVEDTMEDIGDILDGKYPDKLDNYYYPVGRCAMLKTITIMYEKNGFLSSVKECLSEYPEELSRKLISHHLDELKDLEDLERASLRGDVLFYHFSIDNAIDHFLQALFAENHTFFPSRKRSLKLMETFAVKPENCGQRILEVIKLGCEEETLVQSLDKWVGLTSDLTECITRAIADCKV